MLLRTAGFIFIVGLMIHAETAASYKTEIEITPAPTIEETTQKKSGFFGGIKNFFRGSSDTTTTTTETPPKTGGTGINPAAPTQTHPTITAGGSGQPNNVSPPSLSGSGNRPPPFNLHQPGGNAGSAHAPLQPIGPRPDTPASSPWGGHANEPPKWPHADGTPNTHATASGSASGIASGSHKPKFTTGTVSPPSETANRPFGGGGIWNPLHSGQMSSNQSPHSTSNNRHGQPSGVDLSYGGSIVPGQQGRPSTLHPPAEPSTVTTPTGPTNTLFDSRGPVQPHLPDPNNPLKPGPHGSPGPRGSSLSPIPPPVPPRSRRPSAGSSTSGSVTPNNPIVSGPTSNTPKSPSTISHEDFPILPAPKSPSPTPGTLARPSSPSSWNVPLPTPSTPTRIGPPAQSLPTIGGPKTGVSFIVDPKDSTTRATTTDNKNSVATDDEIRTLTEALYVKEVNNQINQITVNPQGKTRSIDSGDEAPQPLLLVDSKAFEPATIAKMRLLFNNYEEDTSTNEHVTATEHKEENDFVDAIMTTSVMRHAMQFLQNKNLVSPDPKTHRDLVKELWFTQYSRGGGRIGSSGFEHVFVNEVKNGTIIGLHNWVYFHEEEKAGRLDYKGYMTQLDIGKTTIMKVRFVHNNLNKPVNTLFIGSSPELEMALYTVCFMLRPDRTCPVSMNNKKFGIVTFTWRYRGKTLIGSAYPEI